MTASPKRIYLSRGEVLIIEWSDGIISQTSITKLRKECPCASCREENDKPSDPFRVLKPIELEPLRLIKMNPVGRYAYKITWSDGHDTGIFSLAYLRGLND